MSASAFKTIEPRPGDDMQNFKRRHIAAVLAAAAMGLPALAAWAQNPNAGKPLRLILPVGAGSGVDTIMRAITPSLSKVLDQPVVLENLPGAGGLTGTSALVKAAPDGMTIGVVSNNHAINPSVYKKMPYDSLADITPIMIVGATPFVLVVNPAKVPAKNVKELVALLKAKPGVYNYGSSGNGTIYHLGFAMFAEETGVDVRHIPYKGTGPMIADIIGGQVEMGVLAIPAVQGHLKSGTLRAIGVTGPTRVPSLPDMPTVAEQGYPGVDVAGWFAVVGPPKLPAADVKRIHDAFTAALATPEVREQMDKQGNVIQPTTPEVAVQYFRTEQDRYAKLVKKTDIKID
jgi:tripartite-type tricarboxylate transporter receptor subunit TctC